ncbi:unnamed protein product, partial [marine sediment metagenome]
MPIVHENTLRLEILKRFTNNHVFIETGTSGGDGVNVAIAAGFEKIISIENDPEAYRIAAERFRHDSNIRLIYGDSKLALSKLLNLIGEPVTFWLDAHTTDSCSLLDELEVIAEHDVKTHTILIDDVRYFRGNYWGITLERILSTLKRINPKYIIEYIDGFCKEDILVVTAPVVNDILTKEFNQEIKINAIPHFILISTWKNSCYRQAKMLFKSTLGLDPQ